MERVLRGSEEGMAQLEIIYSNIFIWSETITRFVTPPRHWAHHNVAPCPLCVWAHLGLPHLSTFLRPSSHSQITVTVSSGNSLSPFLTLPLATTSRHSSTKESKYHSPSCQLFRDLIFIQINSKVLKIKLIPLLFVFRRCDQFVRHQAPPPAWCSTHTQFFN